PANETLESRNARLILGQHIGGRRVAVEPTGLGLGDPDLNQIAADPVAPGEGVQWLPTQKFLDDLALELDRMRAVLGHGLSPRKPGSVSRFSPSPPVHPKGCTRIRSCSVVTRNPIRNRLRTPPRAPRARPAARPGLRAASTGRSRSARWRASDARSARPETP